MKYKKKTITNLKHRKYLVVLITLISLSAVSFNVWPSILLKWSYHSLISTWLLTSLLFSPPRLFSSFQNTDAFFKLVARNAALILLNFCFFTLVRHLYLLFESACSFLSSGPRVLQRFLSFSLLFCFLAFIITPHSTFNMFFHVEFLNHTLTSRSTKSLTTSSDSYGKTLPL